MKLLPLLFLLSCQAQSVEPEPVGVVIVVEYGDIRKVYIKNDGVECWIYYDDEFIRKEKY